MIDSEFVSMNGVRPNSPAPHHQRVFEHPSGFEVREQAGDGLVRDLAPLGVVRLQLRVGIPRNAATAVDLDEAHAVLNQATRQQAIRAELRRRLFLHTVQALRSVALLVQIDRTRRGLLHPIGKFVRLDAGLDLVLRGPTISVMPVQRPQQVESAPLLRIRHPCRRPQVENRRAFFPEERPLISGREESGTPIGGSAPYGLVVRQDYERGQFLVG